MRESVDPGTAVNAATGGTSKTDGALAMSRRRRPSRALRFPLDQLEERASSAALLFTIATPAVLVLVNDAQAFAHPSSHENGGVRSV